MFQSPKEENKDILVKMEEVTKEGDKKEKVIGDLGQGNPEDNDMYTTRG